MYMVAKYEADEYAVNNENMDLRTIPALIKKVILHDSAIIDKRRAICDGCEFKFGLNCKKCGCFIHAKTRVATARCPIGKWEKEYDFMKGKPINGTHASS